MGCPHSGPGCLRESRAPHWRPLAVSLAGHLAVVAGVLAIGVRALPDMQVDTGAVTLVVLPAPQAAPPSAAPPSVAPPSVAPAASAAPAVPPPLKPEPMPEPAPDLPPPLPSPPPPMRAPTPPSVPRAAPPSAAPPSAAAPSIAAPPAPSAAAPAPPAATPGPAAIATWQQAVAAWIDAHQTYPEIARRRGEQGIATLRFLLQPDGAVTNLALRHGSGFTTLDDAALALLAGARLPPPPPQTPETQRWITVPLGYRLAR